MDPTTVAGLLGFAIQLADKAYKLYKVYREFGSAHKTVASITQRLLRLQGILLLALDVTQVTLHREVLMHLLGTLNASLASVDEQSKLLQAPAAAKSRGGIVAWLRSKISRATVVTAAHSNLERLSELDSVLTKALSDLQLSSGLTVERAVASIQAQLNSKISALDKKMEALLAAQAVTSSTAQREVITAASSNLTSATNAALAIQGLASATGVKHPLSSLKALLAHLTAAVRASASCEDTVGTRSWPAAMGAVLASTANAIKAAPSASNDASAVMGVMRASAPPMDTPVGWGRRTWVGAPFPILHGIRGQAQPDWPSPDQIVRHAREMEESPPVAPLPTTAPPPAPAPLPPPAPPPARAPAHPAPLPAGWTAVPIQGGLYYYFH